VRSAACEALGAIGDASAVPALIKALGDGSSVRSAACRALGAIGDASAVPALIKALQDGYWCVRSAACGALKRLGYDRNRLKREYGIRL
jgi:HEAT repeat protein